MQPRGRSRGTVEPGQELSAAGVLSERTVPRDRLCGLVAPKQEPNVVHPICAANRLGGPPSVSRSIIRSYSAPWAEMVVEIAAFGKQPSRLLRSLW